MHIVARLLRTPFAQSTAARTQSARRVSPLRPWLIGCGIVALIVFGPGLYESVRLSLMQRRLDRRLAELSAEQARLQTEQERLSHDPVYVEGLIRSTFKLAQPGELVIPLDPSSDSETPRPFSTKR